MGKPDWWLRRKKAIHRLLHNATNEQKELLKHNMVLPELDAAIANLREAEEIVHENRTVLPQLEH